jgi:hypothetical protein
MSALSSEREPVAVETPAPVDGAQVVTSVAQSVQDHPDVEPDKAPAVIASILAGLYEAQPALFAVTRAGPRTQGAVSLGLGLAEVIVSALLRGRQ